MKVFLHTVLFWIAFLVAGATVAQPPGSPAPQPADIVLEDQFGRKTDIADLRGAVVILVYGDRKSTDTCRALGEQFHVCWHPDAKGQPAAKARLAPVLPLDGLRPGQVSPNVVVVPVACCGKVPGPIRGTISKQVAKASPDVVVWLDYADVMKDKFGLTPGEANVVVIDAAGRVRLKHNGVLDQRGMDKLVDTVQSLRREAVK